MPYSDEYRDLIEEAQRAIRNLLDSSTHDSWINLRQSYGDLREALKLDRSLANIDRGLDEIRRERAALKARREGAAPPKNDWCELRQWRDEAWFHKPIAYRESVVIEALGDAPLTISELTACVNIRLGAPEYGLHTSSIASIVRRLMVSGQLDRVDEPHGRRTRYRYFVRRDVSGPIADLERAFHQGEAA